MKTIANAPREARWGLIFLIAALTVLVSAPPVYANNTEFNAWQAKYKDQAPNSVSGDIGSCKLCHGSSNGTGSNSFNAYGVLIRTGLNDNLSLDQAFTAAEGTDSDGDPNGRTNIEEIGDNTQPGWTEGNVNEFFDGNGNVTSTNQLPVVTISTDLPVSDPNGPYAGNLGVAVSFDGTGSTGSGLSYSWDFGDGGTGIGATPSHIYAAAGTYNVELTVTDNGTLNGGLVSTASTTADIADTGVNVPPTANAGGPYNGEINVAVTFDGTASNDPDGTIVNWDWDFGDGTTGSGETTTHTYAAAGNYTVTLTVTDNEAATGSATTTAEIIDPNVNQPPVADANGPYSGNINEPVTFDGSLSDDPDGTITAWDWDFGDDNVGSGVTTTHAYATPGTYTVTLTVTDNDGATGSDTSTANIIDPDAVCQGITIDNAEWRTQGNGSLRVSGTGIRNGDFDLLNAFDPSKTVIDVNKGNNGKFNFNVNGRNLVDPVPCRVRVEQVEEGLCGEAVVDNAPDNCAPTALLTARGDLYATPVGNKLVVIADRLSGVLYNDFGGFPPLTAEVVVGSGPTAGTLDAFGTDGAFTYTPGATMTDNQVDQFTYRLKDAHGDTAEATVVLQTLSKQTDFKITMNYELGMHCTGFEFAYCCVLPPYNSIVAQVIKPAQNDPACAQEEDGCNDYLDGYPRLLEGDTVAGRDALGRETVVRDWDHETSEFKKYQLRYYHDAQPRQEGNTSKPNDSTLISAVEGNSLLYFNTVFDSACVNVPGDDPRASGACAEYDPELPTNALVYGDYNNYQDVLQGDGDFDDPTDNYANGWLNHFYIYGNLEGHGSTRAENDKVRLGVTGQVAYPADCGAALQPMGPDTSNGLPIGSDRDNPDNPLVENTCGGFSNGNVLTFSANTGTVVFTQANVLEDLPIMLTSPRIWEALGLPLTPFEDTINFFADPGLVDEDAIRPYVAMKASLHIYNPGEADHGNAVIGSNEEPVIGFGTAPIDIPNCERCHSAPSVDPLTGLPNINSPNWNRPDAYYPHNGTNPLFQTSLEDMTNLEIDFWLAYYDLLPGVDSTWYPRLKGAAINMLTLHDFDIGTEFTINYPGTGSGIPQNTRLGSESVICQRCHADNVIANVKSGTSGGFPIPPVTEAIHNQHRNAGDPATGGEGGVIVFNDSLGRDGGCQGCHPAHRSDGVMDNYPVTLGGDNANADDDNRLNPGGCFVGRDVHSNPMKDDDGAGTPSHLNAVGDWLLTNVAQDQGDWRGIWCTNCHSQLGQELWRFEDCDDLIHGICVDNPRGEPTLAAVAAAVDLTEQEAIDMLDPKVNGFDRTTDQTHAAWNPDIPDANIATIEVAPIGSPENCNPLFPVPNSAFNVNVCVSLDVDGDPSVNILSWCTTDDCVTQINDPANRTMDPVPGNWRHPESGKVDGVAGFKGTGTEGAPVPFAAATDARDHWLSAGEPHCADCHAAPYTEQSGNITAYLPFNYPAKASLMRYTRGHQDVTCQGCHESIHGLYPVSPTIDTTSYAQAAALNNDGSHGPLKCASCHTYVDGDGIPNWVKDLTYNDPTTPGQDNLPVAGDFDRAVSWMHTYTDEADPALDVCANCHEAEVPESDDAEYLEHAMVNRTSRVAMDNAERAVNDDEVFGETDPGQRAQLCTNCHDEYDVQPLVPTVSCSSVWNNHLIQGRLSEVVWEAVTDADLGTSDPTDPPETCGW